MPTNPIDDLFKEKLSNFEAPPNDSSWGKILAQLSAMPNAVWATQYLRFIYGSLALLFIALPLAYFIFSQNNPTKSIIEPPKTAAIQAKETETKSVQVKAEHEEITLDKATIQPHLKQSVEKEEKKEQKKAVSKKKKSQKEGLSTKKKSKTIREKKETVNHQLASFSSNQTNSGYAQKDDKPKRKSKRKNKPQQRMMIKSPVLSNLDPLPNPWLAEPQLPYGLENVSTEIDYYPIPLKATGRFAANNEKNLRGEAATKEEIAQSFYKLKGLHIGATFAYNTVWILNQNTYGQFGKYELAYKPKTGYYYGGVLGYDIGNHFGIQLEYHYRSTQGQDYQDRIKRKTYNRQIDMQYQNIPLIFKYKIPSISGEFDRPASFNLLVGVQYSKLYSATQQLNGQEMIITERFRKQDISAVLGLEYNAYISNSLFFSVGIRGSFSVSDINDSKWQNTIGAKSSRNSIVGANVGLHYRIFK